MLEKLVGPPRNRTRDSLLKSLPGHQPRSLAPSQTQAGHGLSTPQSDGCDSSRDSRLRRFLQRLGLLAKPTDRLPLPDDLETERRIAAFTRKLQNR